LQQFSVQVNLVLIKIVNFLFNCQKQLRIP
jgi:hypothetical protein